MHPATRILLLLIYAGFIPWLSPSALALSAMLPLVVYLRLGARAVGMLGRALMRIRYLLLSITVLYLWFTPGIPLWGEPAAWMPTWDGMELAARRDGVLILMVAAVTVLLVTTSRTNLVAGIVRLVRPLRLLGLDPERFATRIALTLEYVPGQQASMRARQGSGRGAMPSFQTIADQAASVFAAAEKLALEETPVPASLPQPVPVPWWEWSLPLRLAAFLTLLAIAFGPGG